MAGNRLGPRAKFIYNADDIGVVYILSLDASFQVAGFGAGSGAPEMYDPNNEPAGVTVCPPPKNFKPRVVFAKSADGKARKQIVATSNTADAYATVRPVAVQLDGETFTTTGRRGETQSF